MPSRNFTHPSLAAAFVKSDFRSGRGLEGIAETFEWSAFAALFRGLRGSSEGTRVNPPLAMLESTPLRRRCPRSNSSAEEAARDFVSFRRFCGVPFDEVTPNHSPIWRFQRRPLSAGLPKMRFAKVARRLDACALIVKRGALVDVMIVSAAGKRHGLDDGQVNPRGPDLELHSREPRRLLRRRGTSGVGRRGRRRGAGGDDERRSAHCRRGEAANWQVSFNETGSGVQGDVERANVTAKS